MPTKITIPAGTRFGRLTVVSEDAERAASGHVQWLCRCDCGNITSVVSQQLRGGGTRSCGCLQRDVAAAVTGARNTKHGMADQIPEYKVWSGMLNRCHNPNNGNYPRYGGRGIKVHGSWLDFPKFLSDMGRRPTRDHSLERIDNDGPYSPENCRWANRVEQGRNRRTNVNLTHNGVTRTLIEWSQETGLGTTTITRRLESGWSIARALTEQSRQAQK